VNLARIIWWDVESTSAFDRAMRPEEIMDKLEERVGPKDRKLFEDFLHKVNKLGAQQELEAQAKQVPVTRAFAVAFAMFGETLGSKFWART
jgi:hypothetical protein